MLAIAMGCASREPSLSDMRSRLDRIAAKCRLPASVFDLRSPDELHFKPDPDAKYEDVDCAIGELRKANLPLKLGFIGNAANVVGNSQ
jgi:hypothetical protein